jgi:hypothetical protein
MSTTKIHSTCRIANIGPDDAMILAHAANPDGSNFRKGQVDRLLPAGNYRVVTDEELIEELPFRVYRRVSTMIFVPALSASSFEMVAIDPQDLQAAQERDLNHGA